MNTSQWYILIAFVIVGLVIIAVTAAAWDYETKPLVIYVAGKYWNSTDQGRLDNTNAAIDAGIQILYKCNYAIIPHFGYYIDKRMNPSLKNSDWYVIDNMILLKADGLLKISGSRGADMEENLALSLGIPVYYDIQDVPNRCNK